MAVCLEEIVIDCADPRRLADFWCAVLGWQVVDSDDDVVELLPTRMGTDEREAQQLAGTAMPSLLLARNDDPKRSKNRLHLDLRPVDRSRDDEVARILALGATRADVGQSGSEGWSVLADPEGNEFCVLGSLADRHSQQD